MVNNINNTKKEEVDISEWVEYKLGDLFDVSIAKSIDKGKVKEDLKGINYITRKSTNNGLEYRVKKIELKINTGNCITMAMIGSKGTCFYQEENFLSSQNMLIFRNNNINEKIGKYLSVIIEKIYKISTDYNAIKKDLVLKDKLKLPSKVISNDDGVFEYEPNWEYMENYITDLEENLNSMEIKNKIEKQTKLKK